MLKLYRQKVGRLEYWEAWSSGSRISVHWGVVGDRGQGAGVPRRRGVTAEVMIQELARWPLRNGYEERPEDDLPRVIVQYSPDRFPTGNFDEVERLWDDLEHLLNEELGRFGLGRCTGVDYSGGELTFINRAVDPEMAAGRIEALLTRSGNAEHAVIAIERDDRYRAVWPPERAGSEVI